MQRTDQRTVPAMSPADIAAHQAASYVRPLDVARAVTRYEIATARYDELVARDASTLSPAEFDAFQSAQQTVAESFGILANAGRLDLIGASA